MIWPAMIEKPPAQYMPAPSEMDRSVEHWVSASEATRICSIWIGSPRPGWTWSGCYVPGIDAIYMRDDLGPSGSEALRIHEHAHRVKGWRHNYERAW